MPSTYKDIQRITGLALATISKHYNGGNVRAENRAAIEAAARALDFRPNEVARSLRTRRSGIVGVLLPELDNDFHLEIVAGLERGLKEAGIGVIVTSSQATADGAARAADLLADRQVDGIVAVPGPHDRDGLVRATQQDVPVVVVDRLVEGLECDAVVLDNVGASEHVVAEFLRHGHSRLGVITGPSQVWTMRERLRGVRAAVRRAGLTVPRERVVQGPLTVETGRAGVHRLLESAEPPTALHATNHELTVGALIALNEAGVRVPEDLSFIGFDGALLARVTRPRTTVFVQPVREIARAAADLVRDRLGAGADVHHVPRRLVLSGELVVGASVAAPAG
jgi:DNA-binding LacI/PurR family transcriptional regulator